MKIWETFGRYRGDYGERDEMEHKLREAYECGREDAMREMQGDYGERSYGGSDDYGERRGVRGTGPYSRYRRY